MGVFYVSFVDGGKYYLVGTLVVNKSGIQKAVSATFYFYILGIRQNPQGPVEFVLNVPPVCMILTSQTNHQSNQVHEHMALF